MLPISDPDLARRRFPVLTVILIAINIAVFIYALTLGGLGNDIFIFKFGFVPVELTQGIEITTASLPDGSVINFASPIPAWLTVFTSMFVHAGWLHILGNMLYLWVFGDNIEDRFGHWRFLLFYLAAGIAAAFLQTIIGPASDIPNVGASGAIAGVLGAYLVLFPQSRIRTLVFFFFITFVRIPAILLLGFWFLLQLISGVGSIGSSDAGVAFFAHVGGFIFGMGVAGVYRLLVGSPATRY